MTIKSVAAAAAATSAVALYIATRNERTINQADKPAVIEYGKKLLPDFGAHLIEIEDLNFVVLDSHKDKQAEDLPVVVMLHGFPDNSLYFYKVALGLVDRKFRVILPSLIGYDSSSASGKYKDKSLQEIAKLMHQIHGKLGLTKFHLVGHDWGSSIASIMAILHPEEIETLTMSAVPHNLAFGMMRYPRQLRYSWYFALMQLPLLPEFWLNHLGGLEWIWNSWSPRIMSKLDKVFWMSVLATFKQPGVAWEAVGYYRQNLGQGNVFVRLLLPFFMALGYIIGVIRKKSVQNSPVEPGEVKLFKKLDTKPINVPTLMLAGENDGCILPEVSAFLHSKNGGAEFLFPKGYKFHKVSNAGHFSFLENPEEILLVISRWFKLQERSAI